MKRIKSSSSFRSMYSKSQKTGISNKSGGEEESVDLEDVDGATNTTRGIASDPLFLSLNNFFDMVQEEIEESVNTRLNYLKRMKKGDDPNERNKQKTILEIDGDEEYKDGYNNEDFNFQ